MLRWNVSNGIKVEKGAERATVIRENNFGDVTLCRYWSYFCCRSIGGKMGKCQNKYWISALRKKHYAHAMDILAFKAVSRSHSIITRPRKAKGRLSHWSSTCVPSPRGIKIYSGSLWKQLGVTPAIFGLN